MKGKDESNLSTTASAINVAQSARSRLAESEKEHVSRAHELGSDHVYSDLEALAMHANASPTLPSGEAAEPINELIRIAQITGQVEKVTKFPPNVTRLYRKCHGIYISFSDFFHLTTQWLCLQ